MEKRGLKGVFSLVDGHQETFTILMNENIYIQKLNTN